MTCVYQPRLRGRKLPRIVHPDVFSPTEGRTPLYELRGNNTGRLREEEPTKNTSSHGNKRPLAPRSLRSDLKLPDRHFCTPKPCKVPPRRVSPVDEGHGALDTPFIVPPPSTLPRKLEKWKKSGWHGITLHGHTQDSGLRKPIKKSNPNGNTNVRGLPNRAEHKHHRQL
jgi:hypothetical protein